MFCDTCGSHIHIKKGSDLVCPSCSNDLRLGEKYSLVAHGSRYDDSPRSHVHGSLKDGVTCYIRMDNLPMKPSDRGMFHAECGDDDNYVKGIVTSSIEDVSEADGLLTVTTLNTIYKFKKI